MSTLGQQGLLALSPGFTTGTGGKGPAGRTNPNTGELFRAKKFALWGWESQTPGNDRW